MNCSQLARRVEILKPNADAGEIARWCSVILSMVAENGVSLDSETEFARVWNDANIQLKAANDQFEATNEELQNLAKSDPKKFTPDQIWILVRALRVQGQLLDLHCGKRSRSLCR